MTMEMQRTLDQTNVLMVLMIIEHASPSIDKACLLITFAVFFIRRSILNQLIDNKNQIKSFSFSVYSLNQYCQMLGKFAVPTFFLMVIFDKKRIFGKKVQRRAIKSIAINFFVILKNNCCRLKSLKIINTPFKLEFEI